MVRACCIVSNFYIKSQLFGYVKLLPNGCIVSNFYIKSQRMDKFDGLEVGCIVSNFYIKSQRVKENPLAPDVV